MTSPSDRTVSRHDIFPTYSAAELACMPLGDRNAVLLAMASSGHFDFIDFGTHTGGGLQFGMDKLNGRCGLGVELSDHKAVATLQSGYYVYSGDLMAITLPGRPFRFAVCRHILEHLPNKYVVGSVLWKLSTLCSELIYVEQPDFTNEPYLRSLGLVSMAATLTYHTCLLTESELRLIVEDLGLNHYLIGGMLPLRDSMNPWIHAIGSPPNRWKWTAADLPKPHITFDTPMYRDIIMLLALNDEVELDKVAASINGLTLR